MSHHDHADRAHPHCSVKEGRLALPYQYFAGTVGSRFLVALRDRRTILGVRCGPCAVTMVPPRQVCDRCFADLRDAWVELGSEGEVVAATVVRYAAPHLPRKPPYVLALIRLRGADTPIAHLLDGLSPEDARAGLPVRAVFAPDAEPTILLVDHFEPVP